ncbi:hypothetical protein [Hyalangium minutum]|uniref:Lipoprotein n=1 Tax=Hyalangium minutum TaxID=394096 RepID=A0A085VZA5_9BACT|nr:hypothetical protein [Hyalangium minutum]KFE60768.1 hypothetical protein DB31_4681 [Hyalangium minutum]
MRLSLPILLGSALVACVHAPRSAYVPPEEAAWFKFPEELPATGQKTLSGTLAAAIQLAMDDFLPRGREPGRGASAQDICLAQRQSYDISAFPGRGELVWVIISPATGACTWGPTFLDGGAAYAVDTVRWRILAARAP